MSDVVGEETKRQKVCILRHAERVDIVFNDSYIEWLEKICAGEPHRFDLNLPREIPLREGAPAAWMRDTPITNVGHFQAKLIGEAINDRGMSIDVVYSSPAYRCVQTANSVLKSMGVEKSVQIRIEPGLFEWLGFLHNNFPSYFTPTELKQQGFNIDTEYRPYLTCDQLKERLDETVTKLYERNFSTMKAILQNTTSGNILVVAHAISLETCSRMFVGKTERAWQELYNVFSNCAFCSMVALERIEGEKLQFIEPPAASITSSSNGSFCWKSVANS